MKILLITPSHLEGYLIGGPIASTKAMLKGIAAHAQSIDVFSTPLGVADESKVILGKWLKTDFEGGRVKYFKYYGYRHFTFSPTFALNILRETKNYDLVVLNSTWNFPTLLGGLAAILYNCPFVVWPHGSLYKYTIEKRSRWKKWFFYLVALRVILRRADAVHFTTNHELHGFTSYFGYTPRYFLQPNGFRLEAFEDLPARGVFLEVFPELRGKKIILFLGRIAEKKGLDILLEAYARIATRSQDVHMVIAGPCENPQFLEQIRARVECNNLSPRVTFTGMLEGRLKLAAFVDSYVFVLSSYSENFGMAVVEAMLCGLPVIVSKEVGVADFIAAEDAGIVVSPERDEVERALRRILSESPTREKLSVKGAQAARSRFSHLQVGQRLSEYYSSIIQVRASEGLRVI